MGRGIWLLIVFTIAWFLALAVVGLAKPEKRHVERLQADLAGCYEAGDTLWWCQYDRAGNGRCWPVGVVTITDDEGMCVRWVKRNAEKAEPPYIPPTEVGGKNER